MMCLAAQHGVTLTAIVFGVVAGMGLAVALMSDSWLHTSEPVSSPNVTVVNPNDPSKSRPVIFFVNITSGLWRYSVISDGAAIRYGSIDYFSDEHRMDTGGETTNEILRGIRKAAPLLVVCLLCVVAANALTVAGTMVHDVTVLISAVLYICSALGLVMGLIFYISAVNDEFSQFKSPDGATDTQVFDYVYGWCFYMTAVAFLAAMTAGVCNVTDFLGRHSEHLDHMLTILPGLDIKAVMRSTPGDQADDADWAKNMQPIIF